MLMVKMMTLEGFSTYIDVKMDFPGSAEVKNLPAVQEMQVQSLGWEDPLWRRKRQHILAWRIPWTGAWWATVHGVTKTCTRFSDWACTQMTNRGNYIIKGDQWGTHSFNVPFHFTEMVKWLFQVDNEVFSIYIVIPGATAEKPIWKDVVKSQLIN